MCRLYNPRRALVIIAVFFVPQKRELPLSGSGHTRCMDRLIELGGFEIMPPSIAQWKGVIFIDEKARKKERRRSDEEWLGLESLQ